MSTPDRAEAEGAAPVTDGPSTDDGGSDATASDGAGSDGAGSDGAGSDGAGSDGAASDGAASDGARPVRRRRGRQLVLRTVVRAWDDNIFSESAAAAFWQTLSLPPLLLGLFGVLSYVGDLYGPDTVHAVQDQVRPYVPGDFATLGADGFGFSDTRAAARRFFKIDGPSIVVRTLQSLARRGEVDPSAIAQAIEKYRLLDVTAGTTGSAGGES